jgi:hypothetical protein
MDIVAGGFTVASFCEGLNEGKIQVDRRYQRSNQIWPVTAQSFLIESVLLDFPVPKLFLHQKTDRVSRKTVRYIVDGQQRTEAIWSFFKDDLRLAGTLETVEARGRTYSELAPEFQDRFLSYGLTVDEFVNTSEEEVREIFRRINSYEVPLNPEEQRHARWQGSFKWYIYHLSRELDLHWLRLRVFTDKQLVRMADMKLLAEVSHALLNGITTTNKTSLDSLYRQYDGEFAAAQSFSTAILKAFDLLDGFPSLEDSPLSKTYSLYSLLLAIIAVQNPLETLPLPSKSRLRLASTATIERNLSILADVVENEQSDGPYARFFRATDKGTNVKSARQTRFDYFVEALADRMGEFTDQ